MNIIIKEIDNEEKIGKNTGNTYRPYNIKTFSQTENKDVWVYGFPISFSNTWSIGDTIDVDIEKTEKGYRWKQNDNTKPSPDKKLETLKRIESKLDILLASMGAKSTVETIKDIAKEFDGTVEPNPTEMGR